jgi:plastocyanin
MRTYLVRLALLASLAAAFACSDSTSPSTGNVVKVKDNFFDPATLTVAVGQKVTWQWAGSNPHNVTWVTSSGTGNSATQTSGTYDRDFSAAGTYDYYCTIHGTPTSGMRGSIVVR